MQGSGASEGIARVDRSLGERKAATVACGGAMVIGSRLGPCDDGGLAR